MIQTYLEAVNIKKSFFKGNQEVKVLAGVDLKVRNAETLAIIGHFWYRQDNAPANNGTA